MLAVTCGTMQMFSDMATGFGFFLPDEVPSDQFKGVDVGFLQGSRRVAHAYRRSLFQGHDLERELFYRGFMFRQKLGRPNERFMGYVERTGANLSATGC